MVPDKYQCLPASGSWEEDFFQDLSNIFLFCPLLGPKDFGCVHGGVDAMSYVHVLNGVLAVQTIKAKSEKILAIFCRGYTIISLN